MTEIIATIITGVITQAGIIVSAVVTSNRAQANLEKSQAVTDTKLEELTREVREHNNFAKRMPVVEEQINVINHRIEDLEKKG